MKNKHIIISIVGIIGFTFSVKAQSSIVNPVQEKTVVIDGLKFPMSAEEYAKQKKIYDAKKTGVTVSSQKNIAPKIDPAPASVKQSAIKKED